MRSNNQNPLAGTSHYVKFLVARTQVAEVIFRLPHGVHAPSPSDVARAEDYGIPASDWETRGAIAHVVGASSLAEAEDGAWIDCAPGCGEVWAEPAEDLAEACA